MEHKERGSKFVRKREFDKAIEEYEKALSIITDDRVKSQIYSNLSLIYTLKNDFIISLECSNKCILLNPGWIKGYLRKIRALNSLEKSEDASRIIVKILEEHKDITKADFRTVEKEMIVCKFFTHKFVLESLPFYESLQFKEDIFVVDHMNRGNFVRCTDLAHFDFMQFSQDRFKGENKLQVGNLSILVADGSYEEFKAIFPSKRNVEIIGFSVTPNHLKSELYAEYPVILKPDEFHVLTDGIMIFFLSGVAGQSLKVKNIFFDFLDIKGGSDNIYDFGDLGIRELISNRPKGGSIFCTCGKMGLLEIECCKFRSPQTPSVLIHSSPGIKGHIRNCEFDTCLSGIDVNTGTTLSKSDEHKEPEKDKKEETDYFKIENCRFKNMIFQGIGVVFSKRVDISMCLFSKCRRSGIKVSQSKYVNIKCCDLNEAGKISISIVTSKRVIVSNCKIQRAIDFKKKSGNGAAVDRVSSKVIIFGSTFEKCTVGLRIFGGTKINNCLFKDCKECILINSRKDKLVFIDRNRFEGEILTKIAYDKDSVNPPVLGTANIEDLSPLFDKKEKKKELGDDDIETCKKEFDAIMKGARSTSTTQWFGSEGVPVCQNCQKKQKFHQKFRLCGNCKVVYYCNSNCQKKHWDEHKASCRIVCKVMNDKRKKLIEDEKDD